jgi:uncharacterized peroxidase-related enzyme
MPRIAPPATAELDAATVQTLANVKASLGMVPNMVATISHAPAVLEAYLAFSDALSKGRLSALQREIVALAVAQHNACGYCLAAHTMIAKGAGLSPEAIRAARAGSAEAPIEAAIAELTVAILEKQGKLEDADLDNARSEGLDDGLILEVTAQVSLNILTNYTNHIAETAVDFPAVPLTLEQPVA